MFGRLSALHGRERCRSAVPQPRNPVGGGDRATTGYAASGSRMGRFETTGQVYYGTGMRPRSMLFLYVVGPLKS